MHTFDTSVELLLAPWRNPTADVFFYGITAIGGVYCALILAFVLLFFAYTCRSCRTNATTMLTAMLGTAVSIEILRTIIDRVRPIPIEIAQGLETSWSFPSGHSGFAVACFGTWAFLFVRQTESKTMQWCIGILATLTIATVILSRLYLRVHYATDVIAGALIGFVWIHIALYSVNFLKKKYAAF